MKNLGSRLDGVLCEITNYREDNEGPILTVITKQCVGASPSGITYDIHTYEFEPLLTAEQAYYYHGLR